ncbi:hypothetical protein GCM10027174_45620 [Salinifilum aidingensis]
MLQDWARHVQHELVSDTLTAEQAVAALAELRRASRDFSALADALLLAARREGASLPALAAAWSTSGRRELVREPDARLTTLADRVGTAEDALERILRLPTPDSDTT